MAMTHLKWFLIITAILFNDMACYGIEGLFVITLQLGWHDYNYYVDN